MIKFSGTLLDIACIPVGALLRRFRLQALVDKLHAGKLAGLVKRNLHREVLGRPWQTILELC